MRVGRRIRCEGAPDPRGFQSCPKAAAWLERFAPRGSRFVDKVNVEVVQVTVTVTDDSGHFVGGIPRAAFKVLEDGKPQTITYFASEDVPLELIVAVDISGSMATRCRAEDGRQGFPRRRARRATR